MSKISSLESITYLANEEWIDTSAPKTTSQACILKLRNSTQLPHIMSHRVLKYEGEEASKQAPPIRFHDSQHALQRPPVFAELLNE